MEENKKILELLQSIEKTNRQQAKLTRLVCILALIAAVFCGCTFGLIFAILPDVNEIIPQIGTVASQMRSVLSDLEQQFMVIFDIPYEFHKTYYKKLYSYF